jgi:hypothetical protein
MPANVMKSRVRGMVGVRVFAGARLVSLFPYEKKRS